jgi:hypothetical protein
MNPILINPIMNLSTYYIFRDNTQQKNLILEPICCLFKLILYQYKKENTKLSIHDNSIDYTEENSFQPFIRMINGDSREDLHNIYYPLLKCLEWYPMDQYPLFYEECKKGLLLLKNVYSDNSIIHHTITHFISIIDKNDIDDYLSKTDKNPLIDELKPYWNKKEINLLKSYLELINDNISKDIYLINLEHIISEKEKKVNEYITSISTTYLQHINRQ